MMIRMTSASISAEEEFVEVVTGWMSYTAGVRAVLPRPYDLLHNREAALAADAISAGAHFNTLTLTPMQHAFCTGIIELICNSTVDSTSYLEMLRFYMLGGSEFANFMDSAARFKLKDGISHLVDKIVADGGADVRLSTPVKAIEDAGDHVQVTTERGETIRARAAVSTLPMNTLASVSFNPALPQSLLDTRARSTRARARRYFCGSRAASKMWPPSRPDGRSTS